MDFHLSVQTQFNFPCRYSCSVQELGVEIDQYFQHILIWKIGREDCGGDTPKSHLSTLKIALWSQTISTNVV